MEVPFVIVPIFSENTKRLRMSSETPLTSLQNNQNARVHRPKSCTHLSPWAAGSRGPCPLGRSILGDIGGRPGIFLSRPEKYKSCIYIYGHRTSAGSLLRVCPMNGFRDFISTFKVNLEAEGFLPVSVLCPKVKRENI